MKSYTAIAALVLVALGTPCRAQEQKPAAAANTAASTTIKVQVVLLRYQGEKKVSSLPFILSINPHDPNRNTNRGSASLRVGTQVPITTPIRQSGEANAPMIPSVQYRDVGTSIDCSATALDDGRYRLDLTIEDSSVDGAAPNTSGTHPVFRSFRTSDSVLLRDGQTAQYSSATDKVNADVWRVEVTLTVVK